PACARGGAAAALIVGVVPGWPRVLLTAVWVVLVGTPVLPPPVCGGERGRWPALWAGQGGRKPPGTQTSRERAAFKTGGPGGRRPRKFLEKALPAGEVSVVYYRRDARCRASVSAFF